MTIYAPMMVSYTGAGTYVQLVDHEVPVARTVSVSDLVSVDFDKAGEAVGVEFAVPPSRISDGMLHRLAEYRPDLFKELAADRSWLYTHA